MKKTQTIEPATHGTIYMIVNRVNGMKYIGQTVKPVMQRWGVHKGQSKCGSKMRFHVAIRQYGEEAFEVCVLAENVAIEIMDYTEQFYIQKHDSIRNGYNVELGGKMGGMTDEIRERISKAQKGRKFSDEHRRKLSEANKRRHAAKTQEERSAHAKMMAESLKSQGGFSEESREKMSISATGNHRAFGNSFFLTDEAKEKISLANSGKVRTEAHKQNMRNGHAKRKLQIQLTNQQPITNN